LVHRCLMRSVVMPASLAPDGRKVGRGKKGPARGVFGAVLVPHLGAPVSRIAVLRDNDGTRRVGGERWFQEGFAECGTPLALSC